VDVDVSKADREGRVRCLVDIDLVVSTRLSASSSREPPQPLKNAVASIFPFPMSPMRW